MEPEIKLTPENEATFNKGFDLIINTLSKALKYARVINKKNKKLLEQNHKMVGKIINCHLLIERLILKELIELQKSNPKISTKRNLTFIKKFNQLKIDKPYSFLLPAIKELNTIRNTLAHNLNDNFDLNSLKNKEIIKTLILLNVKEIEKLDIEQMIEIFTERTMMYFAFRDPQVKAVFKEVKKENPNFTLFDSYY